MASVTIPVFGMTCGGCVNSVTNALKNVDGVQDVAVSLENNEATISFDDGRVTVESMKEAIEDAGYDITA